jgi:hypothetical protein
MQRFSIGVEDALEKLRDAREVIDPNDGFKEQLQVFIDCNYIANTSKAAYRHWLLREQARLQKGRLSRPSAHLDTTGRYGKPDTITYASAWTVIQDQAGTPTIDLRCKKCRYSSPFKAEIDAFSPHLTRSSPMKLKHKATSRNPHTHKRQPLHAAKQILFSLLNAHISSLNHRIGCNPQSTREN